MIIKHRWAKYEHSRDYNTGNLDKLVKVFPHVILAANLQGLGWVSRMVADVPFLDFQVSAGLTHWPKFHMKQMPRLQVAVLGLDF